jgi:hypothetical protein
MVLLKLNFVKAYNKVGWEFLLMAMQMMGLAKEFMMKVKLLFQDAKATICFIGGISRTFKIERGVKQGCPLAPCLVIFAGEVLKFHMVKKMVQSGNIKGITLQNGGK